MPELKWEQIAPEQSAEPMVVTLGPGDDAPRVRFLPFTELTGDAVDEIVSLIRPYAATEEGDLTPDDLVGFLAIVNRVRTLALHPDDIDAWHSARVGISAQMHIIRALVEWYGAAGTEGEGLGLARS